MEWAPNTTPGEAHWYAIDEVKGKRFMLVHGDQWKGSLGYPWYGTGKRIQGWATLFDRVLGQTMPDYLLYGHWHTPNRVYINGITAWCSPSTESYNTYAIESLGAAGEPGQWLYFCSPDGISAEYLVDLSGKR